MLIVNIKALMQKKSALEKRKISYLTIEKEAEVRRTTLSRIATNYNYNFSRSDLEKLLRYFKCQPNDLLTLVDEGSAMPDQ